jgi:hypothetical protein
MQTERIYINGTHLIKEIINDDWTKQYYAKEILDAEIREEILYWRWEIKNVNDLEEAKLRLSKSFIS